MESLQYLVMIAQLILGLSILVGIHEAGHMVAAKFFGMRVEKFSIGFPPKLFAFKKGETEYSIGAIPLGGFVKITGMVDESLDTAKLNEEPKPYEFRAKPAWQRLIVMLGGIIMNVITGIVVFIMLTFINGSTYISKDELNKNGIVAYELGEEIGLKTGDKVLKVNGHDFDRFTELMNPNYLLADKSYYTIQRNGETMDITIPGNLIEELSDQNSNKGFIDVYRPFLVDRVINKTGAEEAGLEKGDKIIEVAGNDVQYFHQLKRVLEDNRGKKVDIKVLRGKENQKQIILTDVQVSEDATIGFYPEWQLNTSSIDYTFAEAIPLGTKRAFEVVWVNVKAFGKMFKGELDPTKSLRGPIGILQEFGGTWDWTRFWTLTGLLSMVLAFMNLLPIPALDGGHVTFLLYEIVSGRKPSDQFLENAQKVGMVILLMLMVFVFANDIINLFP